MEFIIVIHHIRQVMLQQLLVILEPLQFQIPLVIYYLDPTNEKVEVLQVKQKLLDKLRQELILPKLFLVF